MIATWYALVSLMLIVYVVLDGRNFGAGMLHWLVAKTPDERRQVVAAIGPLLVVARGVAGCFWRHVVRCLSPSFWLPLFAGYYLALFLILWCLLLRAMSLELGGHINDRLWQGFWDFVFVVASFLLAILFGAAGGNMARGVPLDANEQFLDGVFHRFWRAWQRRNSRLVHGFRGDLCDGDAGRAWRDLSHAQDGKGPCTTAARRWAGSSGWRRFPFSSS